MINYEMIEYAKKILGLPNKASLNEIKETYHELAQKYHPDKQKDRDKNDYDSKMKELNKAYNILIEYCSNYKCSLDRKDFNKQFPSPYDKEWIFKHSSF